MLKLRRKAKKQKVEVKDEPSYNWTRFLATLVLMALPIVMVLYKTFDIQCLDTDYYVKEADKKSFRNVELPFTRGQILDRNHRILATSVPLFSVSISPYDYFAEKLRREGRRLTQLAKEAGGSNKVIRRKIDNFIKSKQEFDPRDLFNLKSDGYWQLLARATGLEYDVLIKQVKKNSDSDFVRLEEDAIQKERKYWQALADMIGVSYNDLTDNLYKNARKRYLAIARHLTHEKAEYIGELDLDAINIKKEPRRIYPLKEDIAQLIGLTDVDGIQGIEGIERNFNALLIGKNGQETFRRTGDNKVIEFISNQKPYDPQDVVLSIDEEIQASTYKLLSEAVIENKAESGTAVMIDIQTGEILAMATAPSFNPNDRSTYKTELARNRAIKDTFEPGSTVKPFVVLTALQTGAAYRDEIINTGPLMLNGFAVNDVSSHASLSLTGILQKSSNRGVSRLALRMPASALIGTYSKIGFGKDTGLGLGEERGKDGDRKRWSDIERATVSYGYGLEVTPLQLARAYATLGSFGILRPLSITKVDPPVIGERVLPEKITKEVVTMMESVAQKGEGGQKAMIDGYRVAVKTGTARKLEKGRYVERYIAYTAGVAPASDPRFALVVLINEPKAGAYYGGAVSAPLFSKIMGSALKEKNIKPDNLQNSQNAVREINASPVN